MAAKPISMSIVKQILKLQQDGKGIKFISRTLSISKNTVKSYLQKIQSGQYDPQDLMSLEEPVLEGKLHAGHKAYSDSRWAYLSSKLDYFTVELNRTGVTRHLLWQEYIASCGEQAYSYSQFCFHLQQHVKASKPSAVLLHQCGDKLFIDFAGKPLYYVNQATGEQIACQVFVACLPYSGYSFALPVASQSLDDFISALQRCLQFLGGVPASLVPDNLKAAVTKADPYEPTINAALLDFANHYNTAVIPARVRKPKDKALVESQVKMFYTHVYAKLRNHTFFSLYELTQAVLEKVRLFNQIRMQKKDYTREEKFLAEEKQQLQPLPAQAFEIIYQREYKVADNNHIYLTKDKHYYSVPFIHIGQKVKVLYTKHIVSIYCSGNKVAEHIRSYAPGKYTTVPGHLSSQHQHYRQRSKEYYINRANTISKLLGEFVEQLFTQKRHEEQLYNSCNGLFNLQRKTPTEQFEKALQIAMAHAQFTYAFVHNLIINKQTDMDSDPLPIRSLPKHENLRGKDYYAQQLKLELPFKSNQK